MQDINDLKAKVQALESESTSLKSVIEQYKQYHENFSLSVEAYQQTVNEIVASNIALKAGSAKLEKMIAKLQADCNQKDEKLKDKDNQLSVLNTKIGELENQVDPKKKKSN